MFNSSYAFVNLGKSLHNPFKDDIDFLYVRRYKFKTEQDVYIVEVKCYDPSIYIVEFYLRSDQNSKKASKYGRITNNGNALKIISTCFSIMFEHLSQDKSASFAFIGAPTFSAEIEEEESLTQRFRIYRYASINLFGDQSFEQYGDEKNSCYFIINNSVNKQVIKDKSGIILGALYLHES